MSAHTNPTSSVQGSWSSQSRDTADLPPPSNITNLVGKVVLGQLNGDSEQLELSKYIMFMFMCHWSFPESLFTYCVTDSPLAQGFLLTDSHVSITVPQVPDGNYIIVCKLVTFCMAFPH